MEKKDYGDKKTELLVKVARMVLRGQHEPGRRSRVKFCLFQTVCVRLLTDAKGDGNRPVQVVPQRDMNWRWREDSEERVALEKVIIVPKKSNLLKLTGWQKADCKEYLESVVENGDIIGYSWGITVYSVSNF